jgi:RNA polymerase sigma factor (TIGR02999 family)
MSDVTQILSRIESGDDNAATDLLPIVYDELRKLAAHQLSREKPGQTLQATALVHEAYLRLVGADGSPHWNSRGHFFAAATLVVSALFAADARRRQAARQN